MNRTDLAIAVAFFALGACLAAAAFGFPPGMGRLPGPGFFPGFIGGVTLLLGAGLLVSAVRRPTAEPFVMGNGRFLALAVGLVAGYLLLWGWIPFAVRTFAFVLVLLRVTGERWLRAATVAAVLTAAVLLAFQYGLRVSLG